MYISGSSNPYSIQRRGQDDTEQTGQSPTEPTVELVNPDMFSKYSAGGSNNPFSGIWSRTLRVKIIGRDGFERLDVRIPVRHSFPKTIAIYHCTSFLIACRCGNFDPFTYERG